MVCRLYVVLHLGQSIAFRRHPQDSASDKFRETCFARRGDMITTLNILSIGSLEANDLIRDILLSRTKCRLFGATSVWDLSAALTHGDIDVAILHDTLPAAELRSSAHYIRHHWSSSGILLMSAHTELLEDALYEERLEPGTPEKALLVVIEKLAACARMRRRLEARPGQMESRLKNRLKDAR